MFWKLSTVFATNKEKQACKGHYLHSKLQLNYVYMQKQEGMTEKTLGYLSKKSIFSGLELENQLCDSIFFFFFFNL